MLGYVGDSITPTWHSNLHLIEANLRQITFVELHVEDPQHNPSAPKVSRGANWQSSHPEDIVDLRTVEQTQGNPCLQLEQDQETMLHSCRMLLLVSDGPIAL